MGQKYRDRRRAWDRSIEIEGEHGTEGEQTSRQLIDGKGTHSEILGPCHVCLLILSSRCWLSQSRTYSSETIDLLRLWLQPNILRHATKPPDNTTISRVISFQ